MKKSVLKIALLLSAATFLVSCASQQDVEDLRYQLRIVNKKISDMKSDSVDPLQKRQAAASGQMDLLERDIMQLKSQLDESYQLNQRLREQNKELGESISSIAQNEASQREEAMRKMEEQQREKEAQLTQLLNQKISEQEQSVKAIQQARIKDAERRAKEASIAAERAQKRSRSVSSNVASNQSNMQHIKATQTKTKHSVVAPPIVPTTKQVQTRPSQTVAQPITAAVQSTAPKTPPTQTATVSAGNEFSEAQSLYDRQKYSQAYTIFDQVATTSSAANKVDARYMMGECLFAQKEYDKAIMQYQKIIAQNAGHSKAPAAMLKQAMAFEKLADKDTAKVIYKKVLKKHGSSPEAKTAQERLNKL
ncbi:MAG: TolA-binding protein [Desulforhopalus sp.]|jgi:TolA-binding protein